jgi:SAM-dependent methyltransferase
VAVERLGGSAWTSPWREEHEARYIWASRFTRGATVLDVACGTGFGGKILLGAGASRVVAADLSPDALAAAGETLRPFGPRVEVRKEDAQEMTFPDGSFDVVVSFETLEHLPEPERFLSEVARVLKPGAILVLSTPNALVTRPGPDSPSNPFHVHEFTPEELRRLLRPLFRIREMLGQHLPQGYGVAPFLPSFRPRGLGIGGRLNFIYWRALLRLPTLRDSVHRFFTGFRFFPQGEDYTFRSEDLERSHVQVVVAAKGGD